MRPADVEGCSFTCGCRRVPGNTAAGPARRHKAGCFGRLCFGASVEAMDLDGATWCGAKAQRQHLPQVKQRSRSDALAILLLPGPAGNEFLWAGGTGAAAIGPPSCLCFIWCLALTMQ